MWSEEADLQTGQDLRIDRAHRQCASRRIDGGVHFSRKRAKLRLLRTVHNFINYEQVYRFTRRVRVDTHESSPCSTAPE
jgi:hypothetical protein